jgi:hypothetical protein
MRQLITFSPIASRTGDNNIMDSIRTSTRQRNNVIGMPCIAKFLLAIITLILLASLLIAQLIRGIPPISSYFQCPSFMIYSTTYQPSSFCLGPLFLSIIALLSMSIAVLLVNQIVLLSMGALVMFQILTTLILMALLVLFAAKKCPLFTLLVIPPLILMNMIFVLLLIQSLIEELLFSMLLVIQPLLLTNRLFILLVIPLTTILAHRLQTIGRAFIRIKKLAGGRKYSWTLGTLFESGIRRYTIHVDATNPFMCHTSGWCNVARANTSFCTPIVLQFGLSSNPITYFRAAIAYLELHK